MTELGGFLIVFLLAFGTTLALVPLAMHLSHRWGICSTPGGRRRETRPMPKFGGLAIYGGFMVALVAAQALPVPRGDPYEIIRLIGLMLGSTFTFIFWTLDDLFDFGWLPQYVGQLIASGIAIFFLIYIEFFNNPLTGTQTDPFPFAVTVVISLLWLGVMMNTVNFLDGVDGLTAGVTVIACAILFLNSAFFVQPAQTSISLLPLALMGAALAFLLHNIAPARIYLGGGAPLLGYLLGTLSIIGGAKMATILLVMGLPLMDFAWQVVNRLQRGRNPLHGDRGHLHFRLLDSGLLTERQIVLLYYTFCACFGILTLMLESRLYKFMAFGVMVVLVMIGFGLVMRVSKVD